VNTGEIENYGVELEVSYALNAHWHLDANESFLHMKNHVLGAPENKTYLGATWHQNKWNASAGLMYINGLYTEVGENEMKEGKITLKNMETGEQQMVTPEELIGKL
jgi:iron complex outermembrane receptor protein